MHFLRQNKNDIIACLGLFVLAVLCRYPYFSIPVIDWDESAFILVARDILLGHLPFERLYENKPPLLYVIIAGFLTISDSIAGLRLLGSFWVAGGAVLLFFAAKRLMPFGFALLSAVFLIIFIGNFCTERHFWGNAGFALMSEVIATPFICGLIWVLCKPSLKNRDYFMMGLMVAMAGLVRTNLFVLGVVPFCMAIMI